MDAARTQDDTRPVVTRHEPDPSVVSAVLRVRDRFGAHGLRDLIALAQEELDGVERALAELREDLEADRRADAAIDLRDRPLA